MFTYCSCETPQLSNDLSDSKSLRVCHRCGTDTKPTVANRIKKTADIPYHWYRSKCCLH